MTLWQDADARRFVYARREVYYNYPTSGDGAMLSRLDNLADDSSGTTKYAQYTYMGGGSIVKVDHPAVTNGLTLSYGSGGTYAAFERFGRIIDQKWTANGSASDEFTYGYDHAEGGCQATIILRRRRQL